MHPDSQFPLAGGCYIVEPERLRLREAGPLRWTRVIGIPEGAHKLSQFLLDQAPGPGPAIAARDHDAVIFILDGDCDIDIGGMAFQAGPGTGIYVRRGEAFRLDGADGRVRCLLTCCPAVDEPVFLDAMPANFDTAFPNRTVAATDSERQATGDRFFKLLVGPETGSMEVTQFIGMIPRSKAQEHFHPYEEAICVLSGSGRLWTGDQHAPVQPGSIIFLPIRQPHCLECEVDAGMELVGVFYPAGSPAVNYRDSEPDGGA